MYDERRNGVRNRRERARKTEKSGNAHKCHRRKGGRHVRGRSRAQKGVAVRERGCRKFGGREGARPQAPEGVSMVACGEGSEQTAEG